jgi:hypothetical protein
MKIEKQNTKIIRANPEFEKIIKKVMSNNLMKGRLVYSSRVTLAMARQYKKYPYLMKELEEAELR